MQRGLVDDQQANNQRRGDPGGTYPVLLHRVASVTVSFFYPYTLAAIF